MAVRSTKSTNNLSRKSHFTHTDFASKKVGDYLRSTRSPYYSLILLLGTVSLFADIVYEGARSVSGDYLNYLKGPAVAAGLVGAGELLGYVSRFVGGALSTRYRSEKFQWALIVAGYLLQAIVVPLLAFAGNWQIAAIIYITERIFKGIRTPARDSILAEVSGEVGRGLGFGIHELLDQLGAIFGPIIIGGTLSAASYRASFLALLPFGLTAVAFVVLTMRRYKSLRNGAQRREPSFTTQGKRRFSRRLAVYLLAVSFLSMGFVQWPIISYFASSELRVAPQAVAYLYGLAMLADAAVAVPIGLLFDRVGMRALAVAPILAVLLPVSLALSPSLSSLGVAAVLYGLVLSTFETVLRSAVPTIVERERVAFAYGSLGLVQGASLFVGGLAVSYLYQCYGRLASFIYFPVPLTLISLALLVLLFRGKQGQDEKDKA